MTALNAGFVVLQEIGQSVARPGGGWGRGLDPGAGHHQVHVRRHVVHAVVPDRSDLQLRACAGRQRRRRLLHSRQRNGSRDPGPRRGGRHHRHSRHPLGRESAHGHLGDGRLAGQPRQGRRSSTATRSPATRSSTSGRRSRRRPSSPAAPWSRCATATTRARRWCTRAISASWRISRPRPSAMRRTRSSSRRPGGVPVPSPRAWRTSSWTRCSPQPLQALALKSGTGGTATTFKSKFKKNAVDDGQPHLHPGPAGDDERQEDAVPVRVLATAAVNDPVERRQRRLRLPQREQQQRHEHRARRKSRVRQRARWRRVSHHQV